jgi:uncharacterized protein YdeI (YjbR/CyaY-like superfamily)
MGPDGTLYREPGLASRCAGEAGNAWRPPGATGATRAAVTGATRAAVTGATGATNACRRRGRQGRLQTTGTTAPAVTGATGSDARKEAAGTRSEQWAQRGEEVAKDQAKRSQLHVTERKAWRQWLLENHESETEVWLIFHKKHTGAPSLAYEDAVEEALCFGWIDSIVKRVDGEKYIQKFTPRKKKSEWSEPNKKRARKMIRVGKMAEPGLAKIKEAKADGRWGKVKFRESPARIPLELRNALKENGKARETFDTYSAAYKKLLIGWIMSARKEDTRLRRIDEVVELAAQNKRLGMK